MSEPVIVAAVRSGIGRARKGRLVDERSDDMAARMARAALNAVPELPIETLDELYLGVAHQVGEQAQNLARRVSTLLGTDSLPAATVSKACASSLQATAMAAAAIHAGYGRAYLSIGVESVSRYSKTAGKEDRNPLFPSGAGRAQTAVPWSDPRAAGALPDVYIEMGLTAENVAKTFGVSRAEQDTFALRSQTRYELSRLNGFWDRDITPMRLSDGSTWARDESPRPSTTLDGLATLEPAFLEGGTVTAGNSCPLNDGASAVIVTSARHAASIGLRPLARIASVGVSALSPEIMGVGPVEASRRAMVNRGMAMSDIDIIEINEAFAAQVVASARELGVPDEKLNPRGGAIALGHPFGMTGNRLLTTLVHHLVEDDATVGLASLCVGGGMGMAVILERL